jgi:hypothetical protein
MKVHKRELHDLCFLKIFRVIKLRKITWAKDEERTEGVKVRRRN